MADQFPKPPKFIQFFSTLFFIIAGTTLLFCSLFIPPAGEIHASVLAAFGMILTFVGSILGMDYNYKSKLYSMFNPSVNHNPRRKNSSQNKRLEGEGVMKS